MDEDAILIRNGYFAWERGGEDFFRKINLLVPKGALVAVVGNVGCGKTSFLSTMMGDMVKTGGAVVVNGSLSVVTQQPWLITDTVLNNILFGQALDRKKYEDVLSVCCLDDDIRSLPGRHHCEIAEGGANLSGGQKARIAFARACYSDSDIVIMDDPLAAVDANVGKTIFEQCICNYMNCRTRILVTNAVQFLSRCDYVVVLGKGGIAFKGTFADLKKQDIPFLREVLVGDGDEHGDEHGDGEGEMDYKPPCPLDVFLARQQACREALTMGDLLLKEEQMGETKTAQTAQIAQTAQEGKLVTAESKATGAISWKIYQYYLKANGETVLTVCLFFVLLYLLTYIPASFQLSAWMSAPACEASEEGCQAINSSFLKSYTVRILLAATASLIYYVSLVPGHVNASRRLHDAMTMSIMNAPVSFHDVNPAGRVLNRFNTDMNAVDINISNPCMYLLRDIVTTFAECLIICISTKGAMLPVLVLVLIVFIILQKRFRCANSDTQRLASITRSPIVNDFCSVLHGAMSIRAYAQTDQFIEALEDKTDMNSTVFMYYNYLTAWLLMRAQCLTAALQSTIGVMTIYGSSFMKAATFGVALTSATSIASRLEQIIIQIQALDYGMNSVERIKEYIDDIDQEPPRTTHVHPSPSWPERGIVEFTQAALRYRDGPLVMKGVNLTVKSQEKVGIVGRTGAGKSTLMVALFRITDLCKGTITIDGYDISKLGLCDLRRALAIIPQDPVIFSDTVRFNLDPFNECTDHAIWSALEHVHMKEVVQQLPGKLEEPLEDGKSHFSRGEAQLICIARALLRKPKILVMDEATASLDKDSDERLQSMIREQFAECTTLIIAHRLNTIMDCDRICVMNAGEVAEYDTPANLLNKKEGIFRQMILAANDPSLFDQVPGCEYMKQYLSNTN